MATRVYGTNRGTDIRMINVVEGVGAAMVSRDIELSFDLTKNITKEDIIEALEKFKNYILSKQIWPPA